MLYYFFFFHFSCFLLVTITLRAPVCSNSSYFSCTAHGNYRWGEGEAAAEIRAHKSLITVLSCEDEWCALCFLPIFYVVSEQLSTNITGRTKSCTDKQRENRLFQFPEEFLFFEVLCFQFKPVLYQGLIVQGGDGTYLMKLFAVNIQLTAQGWSFFLKIQITQGYDFFWSMWEQHSWIPALEELRWGDEHKT